MGVTRNLLDFSTIFFGNGHFIVILFSPIRPAPALCTIIALKNVIKLYQELLQKLQSEVFIIPEKTSSTV